MHAHVTTPATRALAPLTVRKSVGTVTNTVPNPLAPLTVRSGVRTIHWWGHRRGKTPLSAQGVVFPGVSSGPPQDGGRQSCGGSQPLGSSCPLGGCGADPGDVGLC